MAKEKIIKTNAIRMLDKAKVPYIHRCWEQATGQHTGVELAQALGQDPAQYSRRWSLWQSPANTTSFSFRWQRNWT